MPALSRSGRDHVADSAVLKVALCGNPNSGKTTLFNALTGLRHKVANYPGVTVERVTGTLDLDGRPVEVQDMPGAYSLCAQSPDESIATDVLLGADGAPPDVVLIVIDAVRLERGLYLLSQVADLGVRYVVALNMYDLAQRRGLRIDHAALSAKLGVPVIPVVAHRGEGLAQLRRAVRRAAELAPPPLTVNWPASVRELVTSTASRSNGGSRPPLSSGQVRRMLFDERPPDSRWLLRDRGEDFLHTLREHRERMAHLGGPGLEARVRTTWAAELASEVRDRPTGPAATWTSRLDRVLLHGFFGPLVAVLLMLLVFQALFSWAKPAMDGIDWATTQATSAMHTALPGGALTSLLADGVVAGVGAVLIFLPQIVVLFLFIGLLEDSGYMPRAAFLADRLFRGCGLTGRSLIPLLSCFACAVPGILSTRTIDQRSQRFLTIAVAPLMTCSARLPVYAVLIAAFVPATPVVWLLNLQGLALASMYVLGLAVAAVVALILRRTLLRGSAASFVMELPPYRRPNLRNLGTQIYEQSKAFVVRAGSVILALAIVIWALSYYPRTQTAAAPNTPEAAAQQLAGSYLGQTGKFLEPATAHLGWDWRISVAVLASFPAREVILSTLGTLFQLGSDVSEKSETLLEKLRTAHWEDGPLTGQALFNLPVALSVMVFFALCCQCMATLATIRRETNSWTWPAFVFTYMTVLAVVAAWAVFQTGMALLT